MPALWRESGRSTNSNHIGKRPSNSRVTQSSSKSSSTSSGSISILPNTPSCSVSMKSVRFKPWIALSPGLPLKKGRCGTWTHDYVRHGTTTLFAALNAASGKVSGECYPRHRHQEFIKFLRRLDNEFEPDLELHLIMDNYGTHKHEKVRRFLDRHRRFKVHYIPTSSSWLNLVERWFAELSGKAVRRGSFASVPDLIEAIFDFIAQWNEEPRPFVWTAKAEDILAKIERCRQRLEEISPGCTKPKSGLKKAA